MGDVPFPAPSIAWPLALVGLLSPVCDFRETTHGPWDHPEWPGIQESVILLVQVWLRCQLGMGL